MKTLKRSFWQVPLFCVIAGTVDFYISIYLLSRWAYKKLPDGTVAVNEGLCLAFYAVLFVATFLIGGLIFFRKMTKREIFCSASVLVILGLIVMVIENVFHIIIPSLGDITIMPFEMSQFVARVLSKLTGGWLIPVLGETLSVYLFVLFGRKDESEAE